MAMNQHILSRFAIFLLAIVLIVFGIEHFVHPRNMLIYVPTWIPGGLTWVYIVGAACIIVAVSFMLNQMVKVTAYLLALLLFSFVFCVHLPNYLNTADSEYRQQQAQPDIRTTAVHRTTPAVVRNPAFAVAVVRATSGGGSVSGGSV
jgi:uncharacterized membrane protein